MGLPEQSLKDTFVFMSRVDESTGKKVHRVVYNGENFSFELYTDRCLEKSTDLFDDLVRRYDTLYDDEYVCKCGNVIC